MRPISILNQNLDRIAEIDAYVYFKWHRRYRKPNDFELQINRNLVDNDILAIGNYIAFSRLDLTELDTEALPDPEYRIGIIEFKEITLNESGKLSEVWTIRGRSLSGVFEDRRCLHNVSTGSGYDTQTNVPAETAMKHYIDTNVINPTDSDRQISLINVATDQGRGDNVTTRARFQPLSEILEAISLVGGVGYRTNLDFSGKDINFDVIEGRDLTVLNGVNSPVIFSPDFDNIRTLTYRDSILGVKNVAVVAGQGEADARTVIEVKDGTPTGLDRKETFVDARDVEGGVNEMVELTQRGQETLAETTIETVMEFDHMQDSTFKYLIDFDLGDIVSVIYPGIAMLDSRIIEITEETTIDAGNTFSIVVGSEMPDLISLIKRDRKNFEIEVRR